MRYKYFLIALTTLTAATAAAVDLDVEVGKRLTAPLTSPATVYPMVSYSSAQGKVMRRAGDNTVLKAAGYDTTAADGARHVECYNTGDFSTSGLTPAHAGRSCYNQTLGKFRYWNGSAIADLTGGATATSELTDWPGTVSLAELGHLDGVTSNIQTQISALATGNSGYVSAPPYSDSDCNVGQWSVDSGYHYTCKASNSWGRIAFDTWTTAAPNEPPALFAYQNTSVSGVQVNDITTRAKVGAIIDSATPHDVRQLRVYVFGIVDGGALASKSYIAKLYVLNGSKGIATLLATSSNAISGADILGSSWVTFDFPATTLSQGNAWVIEEAGTVDTANYIRIGYTTTDADDTYCHYATWNTNGTLYAEQPTRDIRYELYE